jgi:SAM-dependent methyltransferase
MSDHRRADPPSTFIATWIAQLADGLAGNAGSQRALDVAMGRGRHAEVLAKYGYRVFGVDWQIDVVCDASARLRSQGFELLAWVGDLTRQPLAQDAFDVVVVTRYLQRDLFPSLRQAVVPGGVVLYETFTEGQLALGRGPTSPDHLLKPLELFHYFEGFDVLHYEEVAEPEAVARIAARRRDASAENAAGGKDTAPGLAP